MIRRGILYQQLNLLLIPFPHLIHVAVSLGELDFKVRDLMKHRINGALFLWPGGHLVANPSLGGIGPAGIGAVLGGRPRGKVRGGAPEADLFKDFGIVLKLGSFELRHGLKGKTKKE
jgi:hypothetical protein